MNERFKGSTNDQAHVHHFLSRRRHTFATVALDVSPSCEFEEMEGKENRGHVPESLRTREGKS